MDAEGREINYCAMYMDLTSMYFLQDQPLHLLRDYPRYEIVNRMNLPRYRDACLEVQEGIRTAAYHDLTRAPGLIYVATRLHEHNTLASCTALFWLESALWARAAINTWPHILERRTAQEIETTKVALDAIVALQQPKVA